MKYQDVLQEHFTESKELEKDFLKKFYKYFHFIIQQAKLPFS
jgi:hypothetical protein